MKKRLIAAISTVAIASVTSAFADGFSWNLQLGAAFPSLSNSDNVYDQSSPGFFNQYDTANASATGPMVGAGVQYQWNYYFTALSLGLSGYFLSSNASGVNYPQGQAFAQGDNYPYSANGSSYALMVEPKWIFTEYTWQPYVLTGIGVAWNHFQGYSETPNGNQVGQNVFPSSATNTNFAYEFGAGIQHPITQNNNSPVIALDYRYMYWGRAGLGPVSTQGAVSLGDLTTSLVMVSVNWPF